VDAGISLTSELSLDALLQRLVETAAELTGAKYAALGVVDPSGRVLERFLTTGVDDEARAAIGDEPVGRGILGVVIREAKAIRLRAIADDPSPAISVHALPTTPPISIAPGSADTDASATMPALLVTPKPARTPAHPTFRRRLGAKSASRRTSTRSASTATTVACSGSNPNRIRENARAAPSR